MSKSNTARRVCSDILLDSVGEAFLNDAIDYEEMLRKHVEATGALPDDVIWRNSRMGRMYVELVRNNVDLPPTTPRTGPPPSPATADFPILHFLIANGLSFNEAWALLKPRWKSAVSEPDHVKRYLNDCRDPLEKALHQVAVSVVANQPQQFRKSYRKLQMLLNSGI